MPAELRKAVTFEETIHREEQRPADPPLRMIGVAAVVIKPWADKGYVQDLPPEITAWHRPLGGMPTDRLIALAGSREAIKSFGKTRLAAHIARWSMLRR